MKFEIGDVVRIKDLSFLHQHQHESPFITSTMMNYANQIATVKYLTAPHGFLHISSDTVSEGFAWHPDWLEPISHIAIDDQSFLELFEEK